jgi:hypothetical protein
MRSASGPFREYYLIDIDATRIDTLRKLIGGRGDVHLYKGDYNEILLMEVFPRVQFRDYRRGLCILDSYDGEKSDVSWNLH